MSTTFTSMGSHDPLRCKYCHTLQEDHINGVCPDESEEEWDLDGTPEDADWIKGVRDEL